MRIIDQKAPKRRNDSKLNWYTNSSNTKGVK